MIQITDSAAKVIRKQLEKNQKPAGGLRIAVKAGGCSGFSYIFAWDTAARDTDRVFEGADGAKVFIDPKSLKLLDGTEIGRASCRERVEISGGGGAFEKDSGVVI